MKILDIKVTGYKMLPNNFELNFLPKTKVGEMDLETEIADIDTNLHTFSTIAFVGSNSSGKTTTLTLINKIEGLLSNGQFEYTENDFNAEKILIEVIYYFDSYIYKYNCNLSKPGLLLNMSKQVLLCPINKEKLMKKKYNSKETKKELFYTNFTNVKKGESSINGNTISNLLLSTHSKTKYSTNAMYFPSDIPNRILLKSFLIAKKHLPPNLVSDFISVLDNSIENIGNIDKNQIENEETDRYKFKRKNKEERTLTSYELGNVLSSGTKKGLLLYSYVYLSLALGNTLIIDEIEKSFHKNLVDNIILLYNDSAINVKHATLIFSTHYLEIIDTLNRRDSIFVMHKDDGIIAADNMYEKYHFRSELSKSKQYNNNAFNTLLNYDLLMKIKREMIKATTRKTPNIK